MQNVPINYLIDFTESKLKIIAIDETGLAQKYDLFFSWSGEY
jgi:hypothetical protein